MARVKVRQGELLGKIEKNAKGGTFISFKGIPYATPPVGKLRFKAPLPPENWSGIRDATEHGQICPQVDFMSRSIMEGGEDCLFLNVYSPNLNGKYSVMVWLHGGAFISGSGDSTLYGPDYFLEEGVVVVTINYRLETLGFLCLDIPEVPGNAGLKDQVLALRWVKENISQFGGDPDNITVFGESAGGVSATFHMISPMSQGLLNKVICQSGCILNNWATRDKSKERAFKLGKLLGKETNDPYELLEYLQGLPVTKLINVTSKSMTPEEKMRGIMIAFGPTIEKLFDGQECFLPKSVECLLEENKFTHIPALLGYNDRDGLFTCASTMKRAYILNENFSNRLQMDIVEKVTSKELKEIGNKIKHFYFGDKGICPETIIDVIDMETDYMFAVRIIYLAWVLSQRSPFPVFLNRFAVEGELNISKHSLGQGQYIGACHADDLFYLFKPEIDFGVDEESESFRALKKMVRMWTNFAKYGNPTPNNDDLIKVRWEPVTESLNYLDIRINELIPGKDPKKVRYEFWKDIYSFINKKKSLL